MLRYTYSACRVLDVSQGLRTEQKMRLATMVFRHLHGGNEYNHKKKGGLPAEFVPDTFRVEVRRITVWTCFLDMAGIGKAETYMNQKHNYTVYFLTLRLPNLFF